MKVRSLRLPLLIDASMCNLAAQVSATIDIDTTRTTPLKANFSGFNDEVTAESFGSFVRVSRLSIHYFLAPAANESILVDRMADRTALPAKPIEELAGTIHSDDVAESR
jgi:hypothetical protein